jgi:hypothetical protein
MVPEFSGFKFQYFFPENLKFRKKELIFRKKS